MKPKRIHTRSRPCGRVNAVSAPSAAACSRAAATSWDARSSGSDGAAPSILTRGPWRSTARPARSARSVATSAPSVETAPQPNATPARSGHGTAAKSNSGRASVASARGWRSRSRQLRGRTASSSDAAPPGAVAVPAARELVGRAAPGRRRSGLLLLAKHRVLHLLREAELAHALRGDLDGLAGLRVAADARLAVREHELAESRKHPAVLRLFLGEREH